MRECPTMLNDAPLSSLKDNVTAKPDHRNAGSSYSMHITGQGCCKQSTQCLEDFTSQRYMFSNMLSILMARGEPMTSALLVLKITKELSHSDVHLAISAHNKPRVRASTRHSSYPRDHTSHCVHLSAPRMGNSALGDMLGSWRFRDGVGRCS